MQEPLDALEKHMQQLQQAMRQAQMQRDQALLSHLRAELRRAQRSYDALFDADGQAPGTEEPAATHPGPRAAKMPAREQVHQVLTLLTVPAAPKLISQVHEALFAGSLPTSRLATLRRDEERSYRSSPGARPYYLCPALTSDHLSPARALLTISVWPLEERIVGPLSARVHYLTSALKFTEAVQRLTPDPETMPLGARQLVHHYALNIPGALPADHHPQNPATAPDLALLHEAAQQELAVHTDDDTHDRRDAAQRARQQLDEAGRLFGAPFQTARHLRSVT
ncbi:hypothetical protein OHA09_36920 [Streptomyces longwoodensis]|uniref:hypothetical protein n=1 Tax=Streptomyces longwoodensis TaxID=68231 RepID=UPI002DD7AEDA|nr:hypothetical protein [Streptomyces longwoodensis]WRY92858.1 hypothetical protein OG481_32165 [Streptomyces longwoodensis]WUC55602.1 hypothetical protein OHA09_00050 [Streptomyces longwoodensis]WUC62280.1 hypothetical protein OHA09_36920 [Streptomyces longwoodensis]